MGMIRTTITISDDTHEQLMLRSFKEKKPLGKIIDELMTSPGIKLSEKELEREAERELRFLKKLGRRLGQADWALEIREERDRDNV